MIVNSVNNAVVAYECRTADTFFSRLKGLLGTKTMPPGQALLIRPCNSVHTVGMRYSIDVLFLTKNLEVLKIVRNMPPMRIAACLSSAMVLELPSGTVAETGIEVGHQLEFT